MKKRSIIVLEEATLSRIQDGVSLIPLPALKRLCHRFNIACGDSIMFRSMSDMVANELWKDKDILIRIMKEYQHIFEGIKFPEIPKFVKPCMYFTR